MELYKVLAQVRFTTGQTKLDVQYKKHGVRVASRDAEKRIQKLQKFSSSVQLDWISLPYSKHFVWDITIDHLNVNSLRNKIQAAEELIDICLL